MTTSLSTPAALLGRPATYRRLAHVASALVLGPAWFALLVAGWALGVGLAITLLGIPVLIGLSYATRFAARVERVLADDLLDAGIPQRLPPARVSPLRGLWAWLGDGASWREQAFLLWRFLAGLPIAVGVLIVIAVGLGAITAPIYYRWGGGIQLGDAFAIDTLGESLAVVPLGLVVVLLCPWVIGLAASANRAVAQGLLMPPAGQRSNWTPAGGPFGRTAPDSPAIRLRALAIHAGVVAVIGAVLVAIWALTTPGGYFWPAWPLIALAVPLAIHGLVTALQPFGTGSRARVRGLWLHAGIAAIVVAYLAAVWALSTPGGYFWVMWVMLALALPLGAHAVAVSVGRGDRAAMAERIDTLTASRAGAVDAQAAELRRIERDLHDGAQARLVALALDLGMARERLAEAPPETRALVEGAHEQAKRALVELRDLARGIHPAVLTDRGLAAAIETLAGHSPIPVELDLATGARAPAAVEAAAYFVVAEALTNAAKHSSAARASVHLARQGALLRLSVADDGGGGADPAGSGLAGLRHRVEALDGVLTVTSPPGGGTVIGVELPCGS